MTTTTLAYGLLAFVLTYAENWVGSRERASERKSRTCRTRKWSVISANWSTVFEVILLVDILLTVAEPLAIFPWVVAGGWLGQFQAAEKERKKFRANAGNVALLRKKARRAKIEQPPQDGAVARETAVSPQNATT